jgi:hypothetical protein
MYKLLKKRVAVSRQTTIPPDQSMQLTGEEFKTFIVLVTERVRDAIGDQEREGEGGHPSGAGARAATGPKGPSPAISVINGWSDDALQYVWEQRMEAIRAEDESASVLATGGAPQGSSLPGKKGRASGIFSEEKEEEEDAASVGPQRGASAPRDEEYMRKYSLPGPNLQEEKEGRQPLLAWQVRMDAKRSQVGESHAGQREVFRGHGRVFAHLCQRGWMG